MEEKKDKKQYEKPVLEYCGQVSERTHGMGMGMGMMVSGE